MCITPSLQAEINNGHQRESKKFHTEIPYRTGNRQNPTAKRQTAELTPILATKTITILNLEGGWIHKKAQSAPSCAPIGVTNLCLCLRALKPKEEQHPTKRETAALTAEVVGARLSAAHRGAAVQKGNGLLLHLVLRVEERKAPKWETGSD